MISPGLPLLAFGFGNLAMLGWLAAAAVPLVIHLWNRRRYREVPWAAMQYLLAAMRKNSRRLQIEQWLLLAIRAAILTLIALAAAEPFLERAGLPVFSGQPAHRLLVLDGSYSMSYRPGDASRFELAQEIAQEIVEQSPQGDAFSLVIMADPPRVVVAGPAFDRNDVGHEIEGLAVSHTGSDLPATLATIEQLIERARQEQPRLRRHEVYFLTDLTRAAWLPDDSRPTARADLRERSARLAEFGTLTLVNLGQGAEDQLAVTEATLAEDWATVGRPLRVEARVRHFGRQAPGPVTLELLADGQRVGETTVELATGGQATATARHRFDAPGPHALELRLPDDSLPVDNHRWLAVDVRETLRVLCINGKPSGETFGGATDYLAIALAPLDSSGGGHGVQVDVASENALSEATLADYDCVFLANVAQFTAGEAKTLDGYLRQGGGVVFFLGEQVRTESYERYLGAGADSQAADSPPILPVRLGGLSPQSLFHFDPGDYRHPLIRDFQNQERSGLLAALVYRYQQLAVPENSSASVALRFLETGDPAIVEQRYHRGRVIVVATSADATWNAWVMGPSYLPIVQEMLALAVRSRDAERNLGVGQPLGGVLASPVSAAGLQVTRPDGQLAAIETRGGAEQPTWSYGPTDLSGVYNVRPTSGGRQGDLFAVNVDTAESDLEPLDPAELRDEVWSGVPFVYRTRWEGGTASQAAELSGRGGVHRPLLGGVVLLLVADTLLSWYFGRSRG